ncbi:MAG: IS200/IS605 family transposase [Phycisphaerae bacterium]|nr:IS200/IS605 family transposase [Phycisphaerae bacterium]
MAQSLARIITHIIFSTKYRKPMIPPEIREELNAYLGGILKRYDCSPIEINCPPDHAHILCCLSKNHALAEILEEVKKGSSKWMKKQSPSLRDFYWQGGYGASSVSQSNVAAVRKYIANQQEHHRKLTFQEEFRAFLKRHQIEFDERYVWD